MRRSTPLMAVVLAFSRHVPRKESTTWTAPDSAVFDTRLLRDRRLGGKGARRIE